MKKPNFFIVGAPKCGTSSLAAWLDEHPEIFMSPIKEPHYYSTDLIHHHATETQSQYEYLFKGATDQHVAVGEASVWSLYSDAAVPNILEDTPNAKFIVCLRNPVDMAYSAHGYFLKMCREDIQSFDAAWEAQPSRARNQMAPKYCDDLKYLLYGEICLLGKQMEKLFWIVPRSRVKVIFLADMKVNPDKCFNEVVNFLGASDIERDTFPVENRAQELRHPFLYRTLKSMQQLRHNMRLPPLGLGKIPGRLERKFNQRKSKRGEMDAVMRDELINYFADDIIKLEKLLEINLTHWQK